VKIHLAWIRVTATAAVLAGVGAQPAAAQYAPYRPIPQQPAAPAAQPAAPEATRVAAQQPYWQQAAQPTASPRYQTPTTAQYQQQQAQYPQTSGAYVPTATAASVPSYTQSPSYAPSTGYTPAHAYTPTAAQGSAYPHVAYQPNGTPTAAAEETMPAPVQDGAPVNGEAVNGMNGHMHNGHMHNGHVQNGYPAGSNCNTNYPAGSYHTGEQACGDGYGIGEYFDDSCHDSQWFGGVYYLFMERDRPSPQKLTVSVDHDTMPDPYYPQGDRTVLVQPDHDFRSGVEVRFGSTFTIGDSCDTCNTGYSGCNTCAPCSAPSVYAWEVAWWGLDDDPIDQTYVDDSATPRVRIYGMKNFVGLEYDRDGVGATYAYRPVNDYYDYGMPIDDPGLPPYADGYVRVVAQRVRTNFKAQNLELNIIRFPVCEVACGGCNTGCDSGCYTGCDTCEPACTPSAFSMYGSCGVRYFRADDDFMYATQFAEWDAGAPDQAGYIPWSYGSSNELFYDIQVDNNLLGPQLGWTMNYCYGCKWNFFLNSTFGVFANHIEQSQRMWSGGGGTVRFAHSGEEFEVESDKDDISFLGELRVGGAYDLSCHWRAIAAYRAVAMTGIATSTDQMPQDFSNAEWVAIIDSDNSMIVHGVQVGAECRY